MGAQQAVAEPVKSADPHAANIDRQRCRQAGNHFFGRFVGESHRQNAVRTDLAGGNQPGDTRRQHPCFAAAGAGEDQCVDRRQRYGLQLRGGEVYK